MRRNRRGWAGRERKLVRIYFSRYRRGSERKPWSEQSWLARIRRALRRHDCKALAALLAEGDARRPEEGRVRAFDLRYARQMLAGTKWWRLAPVMRAIAGLDHEHGVLYGTWPGNDCPLRPRCGLHQGPLTPPPPDPLLDEVRRAFGISVDAR